jgi:rubredoxin
MAKAEEMFQGLTVNCGCIYDHDREDRKAKIARGTSFDALPEDWKCPFCGASRTSFQSSRGS